MQASKGQSSITVGRPCAFRTHNSDRHGVKTTKKNADLLSIYEITQSLLWFDCARAMFAVFFLVFICFWENCVCMIAKPKKEDGLDSFRVWRDLTRWNRSIQGCFELTTTSRPVPREQQ
jgi:hypothetical protein